MPRKPKSAGELLRGKIAGSYELRADESAVLDSACAVADVIAELEAAWSEDGRPMTTRGSMGQLVIHPLIGEIRAQRAAQARLLAQLKLPDESVAPVEDASSKARRAAVARWSRGA